jgi:hypothetical protein
MNIFVPKSERIRSDSDRICTSLFDSINQNILNENNLNEIEMVTAKLSNVRTNIILKVHQMNKLSQQRYLYELGKWSE